MRLIQLKFIRVGNHWYLNVPHDNANYLRMDAKAERFLSRLNPDEHVIDSIYLLEQSESVIKEGLIEFKDTDLRKIFYSNKEFEMEIFINNHSFIISSRLYPILEERYKLDLHLNMYRLILDKTRIY